MKAKPAIVGAFILGGLALAVLAILFFGGTEVFAKRSRVVVFFNESVAGLDVGAPVTLDGARIGSVRSVTIHFNTETMSPRIPVVLEIDRARVIVDGAEGGGQRPDFPKLVRAGLRAQLSLQSLITGQLRVDFVFRPGTPAPAVGTFEGLPEIPAVTSEVARLKSELTNLQLQQFVATAERTFASVERLSNDLDAALGPLVKSAHGTLDAATHTLKTTDRSVQRLQAQASVVLQHLDVLLVDAHRQLDARGGEVSRTLLAADGAAREADLLLKNLNQFAGRSSESRREIEEAIRDLPEITSDLRRFLATVEAHPNALLWGTGNR